MQLSGLATVLIIANLVACTAVRSTNYDHAEQALARGDYQSAYRLLEDYFAAGDQSAIALYESIERLQQAATDTFSTVSMAGSAAHFGDIDAAEKNEIHRLALYQIVATDEQYQSARKNLQNTFARIRAESVGRRNAMISAMASARIKCNDADACSRAYQLTQIYINNNATTKTQLVTDTIIETYNVIRDRGIAMRAIKTPTEGRHAEINITVHCKPSSSDYCYDAALRIYSGYPEFVGARL